MDEEMNLASKFGGPRGKLKRLRKGKTGVGMEKPVDIDIPEEEAEAELELPVLEDEAELADIDAGIEGDMEEDEAFLDLLNRMEGESASAGRARKRREAMRKPGNDSLRAEFADRLK